MVVHANLLPVPALAKPFRVHQAVRMAVAIRQPHALHVFLQRRQLLPVRLWPVQVPALRLPIVPALRTMQERPLAQQPRAIVHVLRTTAALLLVRKPLQIALALRIAHLLVQHQHPTMEHLLVAVAITTAVVTIAVRPLVTNQ